MDFEKKPQGTGDFIIPDGQSVTFHYRFYLHQRGRTTARVADAYRNYSGALPR